MCIIAASKSGRPQPSERSIRTMFENNPHGAGYMYARDGRVIIHKGFMFLSDYMDAIRSEHFTADDSVVYHFRISTQAGVNPAMTHPFPLSNRRDMMKQLDISCRCGVAHNGIINLTSDPTETEYSDTAIFITDFMTKIIKSPDDLLNQAKLARVYALAQSKFAILDGSGTIATIGQFNEFGGVLYSNYSFMPRRFTW